MPSVKISPETTMTYRLPYAVAGRASHGDDVHAGYSPWPRGSGRVLSDSPGVHVVHFRLVSPLRQTSHRGAKKGAFFPRLGAGRPAASASSFAFALAAYLQPPPLPLQPPSPPRVPSAHPALPPPLCRARMSQNYHCSAESSGRPRARHATPPTSSPGPAAGCCRQQEWSQQRPASGQRAAAVAP